MKKTKRKVIAEETLETLRLGYYDDSDGRRVHIAQAQKAAEKGTLLYTPEQLDALLTTLPQGEVPFGETRYEVIASTTLDAVRQLYEEGERRVFCLNFASAKNPGGGFLGGAQAQEESVARATGLYPCLLKCRAYYDYHRQLRTCLYSDHMIYAPEVPIFKDEGGRPLPDAIPVSILTSPAVNAGVVRRREPKNTPKIPDVMKRRIAKMLAVAAEHQHETLVLGAWGCGVFQNDPQEMAVWHKEVLDGMYAGRFRRVVFAVYARDERFIKPFRELFAFLT